MTRERLIQIGNNTLVALRKKPRITLGDVLERYREIIKEMGFNRAAIVSEQNFGMTKLQMAEWEMAASRELGGDFPIEESVESGSGHQED